MNDELLTFECDASREVIEIYANRAGLDYLIDQLMLLRDTVSDDHIHLMTPAWGGSELSDQSQNPQLSMIQHVKILKR